MKTRFLSVFLLLLASLAPPANAQNLMGDDLFLDGGVTNQPDIFFDEVNHRHSICMRKDFFRFLLENDGETATNIIFEINNDAPQFAAGIFANGFGIGTQTPTRTLHISTSGAANRYQQSSILVENTHAGEMLRNMLTLRNNGAASLVFEDTGSGPNWTIDTQNGDFGVKLNNATTNSFQVGQNGNVLIAGNLELGSSRHIKANIEKLSLSEAVQTFAALEPVKFNYLNSPDEQSVGFIAEDVPDLVATNSRKSLSTMDMVAVLTKVVQEQQRAIESLSTEIASLKKANNR